MGGTVFPVSCMIAWTSQMVSDLPSIVTTWQGREGEHWLTVTLSASVRRIHRGRRGTFTVRQV